MKPKLFVFSIFDWCFTCGFIIIISILFFIPFFDHNNRAILYMALKRYEKAEKKWVEFLGKDSFSSFYRMNLGLNYMLFDQPDKAIKEYELTRNLLKVGTTNGKFKIQKKSKVESDLHINESKRVELEDMRQNYKNEILFYSFFNSAIASSQKGEVESALDFYQQALEPSPNSLKVKTNIELLVMQNQTSQNKEKNKDSDKNKSKEEGKDKEEDDSKGSSKDKQQDKKEGQSSEKGEEKNKGKKDDDKKAQQGNKGKEGSNQEEQQKEQQDAQENNEDNTNDKSDQDSSESQLAGQRSKEKQNVNERQKEAILKAILEQEKKIRERRSRKSKRKSSPIEKDW